MHMANKRELYGRRVITTDVPEINETNIVEVLEKALTTHLKNSSEIDYLYNYLRGKHPIRYRVKEIRPEINNKIAVNLANEIVTLKTANAFGDPVQYVSRGAGDKSAEIDALNSMMLSKNKPSKDMQLGFWMFTAGTGYRLVIRDRDYDDYDDAPFEIYIPDPRDTFVIYSNDVTHRPMAGVTMSMTEDYECKFTVYTRNQVFYMTGSNARADRIDAIVTHNINRLPLVEYPCNALRMGAFEVALSLLDALDNIESNRLDGIEQFIQALMIFENVDVDQETFTVMKEQGALKITNPNGLQSKVYYLNEQLDQSQTQTLIDDLMQLIREIVGMPAQGNANTSDSSNNGAVIMKNGWWGAESRAKETTWMFTESETEFLKVVLAILKDAGEIDLRVSDIQLKFSRQNYENSLIKVQNFQSLINAGCPPIQAFTISGVTVDPESAAIKYEEYQVEQEEKMLEKMQREAELTASNQESQDKPEDNE